MESHLGQTGGFSPRSTCVLNRIASSMLSTSSKKALSFRAVDAAAERGRDRGWVGRAACASGTSPRTCRGADSGLPVKDENVEVIQTSLAPVEATQLVLVERIQERIAEQIVDFFVDSSQAAHC